jgi:hypothetical protein
VTPGRPGFHVVADDTDVTVTNLTAMVLSIDCLAEYWHTVERAFGAASVTELDPRPFIQDLGDALNEGSAVLGFGAGSIQTGGGNPSYLWPWFDQDANSDGEGGPIPIEMPVPRAGTIRDLTVQHNAPVGNGALVDYVLHVNGAPTTVVLSVASNLSGPFTDLANSVAVALGDSVSLIATPQDDISSGKLEIVATMRFDA